MIQALSKMFLSSVKLPSFGVDISDSSVKYLKLSRNKHTSFDFWGEIKLAPGLVEDGEIKKEDELSAALREISFSKQKRFVSLRSNYVVASLPEEKSFLRVIQMPRIKEEEIAGAIKWELEANVPLQLEELYFDYEVIESGEGGKDHYDVLIVAFPRRVVDSYVRVFRNADLIPIALELETQSTARAIIGDVDDKQKAVIIVDIGFNRTTFLVFAGGTIVLTITINLGGRNFDAAIVKGLGVTLKEAEDIKKRIGLNKREMDGKVYEALVLTLSAIVDELKRETWYYQDHISHRHGAPEKIEKIYLCGGDSNLNGLTTYLGLALNIPVVLGDPFFQIRNKIAFAVPPIAKNKSLAFTTVVGLALRTLD